MNIVKFVRKNGSRGQRSFDDDRESYKFLDELKGDENIIHSYIIVR